MAFTRIDSPTTALPTKDFTGTALPERASITTAWARTASQPTASPTTVSTRIASPLTASPTTDFTGTASPQPDSPYQEPASPNLQETDWLNQLDDFYPATFAKRISLTPKNGHSESSEADTEAEASTQKDLIEYKVSIRSEFFKQKYVR
jgi:peptidoglycan hydrolase-like protein with peptidoglycan-binding domain